MEISVHTWNLEEMNIIPHTKGQEAEKSKISTYPSYFYNFVYSTEQSKILGAPQSWGTVGSRSSY